MYNNYINRWLKKIFVKNKFKSLLLVYTIIHVTIAWIYPYFYMHFIKYEEYAKLVDYLLLFFLMFNKSSMTIWKIYKCVHFEFIRICTQKRVKWIYKQELCLAFVSVIKINVFDMSIIIKELIKFKACKINIKHY